MGLETGGRWSDEVHFIETLASGRARDIALVVWRSWEGVGRALTVPRPIWQPYLVSVV